MAEKTPERVAKDALYAAVRDYDADAIDAALTAASQLQLQSSHAYQMAEAQAPSIRQQDMLKREKYHKQSSKKCKCQGAATCNRCIHA